MAVVNVTPPSTLSSQVIERIQVGLKNNLEWLDYSFGKAERIIKQIDGRDYRIPAIYQGLSSKPSEYLELSPDSKIGNFSFFWMKDPEEYIWRTNIPGTFRTPFALIFWFDLRTIFSEANARNIDYIEKQILDTLNGGFHLGVGAIEINSIYHLAENIYQEFDIDEVDNQFLMHPFAGLRFEGKLIFQEQC